MTDSVGFGAAALLTHTYPSEQFPVGAVRLRDSQYIPGVHGRQSETLVKPESFENVPTGHGVGTDEPTGHQKPGGQIPPIPL